MSGHTPEPWKCGGPSIIYADDRRITLGYSRFQWGNGASRALRRANTRRIVACVNACLGIPTPLLEEGKSVVNVAQLLGRRNADLLLALEDIGADGCLMPEDGEPCGSCGACVAEAAIEDAEKKMKA